MKGSAVIYLSARACVSESVCERDRQTDTHTHTHTHTDQMQTQQNVKIRERRVGGYLYITLMLLFTFV